MPIDPAKLPKPVLSRDGKGKSGCIDTRIYVTKSGFVSFTQQTGIDYPCGTDRGTAHDVLDAILDEAQKIAR